MRAPGMTMMRMPVFCWMTLVVSFLIILAFPAITIALVELMFDRNYGTNFYDFLEGRKATPLAAPLLDFRTSRGVHPYSARNGYRF